MTSSLAQKQRRVGLQQIIDLEAKEVNYAEIQLGIQLGWHSGKKSAHTLDACENLRAKRSENDMAMNFVAHVIVIALVFFASSVWQTARPKGLSFERKNTP